MAALHYASLDGENEVMEKLLDAGTTLLQDKFRRTALHIASTEEHEDVVRLVLDSGGKEEIMRKNKDRQRCASQQRADARML